MGDRRSELSAMLAKLHLGVMAEHCATLELKAVKEGLSHEAFLT